MSIGWILKLLFTLKIENDLIFDLISKKTIVMFDNYTRGELIDLVKNQQREIKRKKSENHRFAYNLTICYGSSFGIQQAHSDR